MKISKPILYNLERSVQGIIIQVSRFIIPWEEGNIGSNLPKAHRNNGKWSFGILVVGHEG